MIWTAPVNPPMPLSATVAGVFRLDEVTVSGMSPVLQTENPTVGTVISGKTTDGLPLNGRNFSQLALLVPGTTPGPVGGIRQTGGGNETKRDGAEITTSGAAAPAPAGVSSSGSGGGGRGY